MNKKSLFFILLAIGLGIIILTKFIPNSYRANALLFEKHTVITRGGPENYNITDVNGNLLTHITANASDGFYVANPTNFISYTGYSKGTLFKNAAFDTNGIPLPPTRRAVVTSTGKIISLPPSLVTRMLSFTDFFVGENNTLFAVVHDGANTASPYTFSRFAMQSGKEDILLRVAPADMQYDPYFQLEDMSASGRMFSFLVSDTVINSRTVHKTAVASYNAVTGKLTVNLLPDFLSSLEQLQTGKDESQRNAAVGVSADGNIVVYQASESANSNKPSQNLVSSHIYNVARKIDVTVATDIAEQGGFNSFFFSPKNDYVVFHGGGSLDIVRVADGKIVVHFNPGKQDPNTYPHKYAIVPVGWIDNSTLAYIEASTTTPGNFDLSTGQSKSVNVQTGKIKIFPKDLGTLQAVIYR